MGTPEMSNSYCTPAKAGGLAFRNRPAKKEMTELSRPLRSDLLDENLRY